MSIVVIGCVTGVFLVFSVCVIVLLIKSHQRSKRDRELFRFDMHGENTTCKSTPASRKTSCTLTKNFSSPNLYGTVGSLAVQSYDDASHLHLMQEHVQPIEKSNSTSVIQSQSRCVSFMHEQIERSVSDPNLEEPVPRSSAQGRIWFTVHHDALSKQLTVTLVKLENLVGRSSDDDTRDPFVKVFLLPDEHTCKTSKTAKKSLNPVYNEQFLFHLDDSGISHRSVRFSVYDVDKRRVRHSLGHVRVPIQEIDINSSVAICRTLEASVQNTSSGGEVNIGLTFQPQNDKLKVVILRTRNIRSDDVDAGLYVNLYLFYGPKLLKTKKTLTHKVGPETSFNESFSFSTTSRHVDNINFRLNLMQTSTDAMSDDVEIGHVNLGAFMFARGSGLLHWQEMMSHTRTMVTKWHQLMLQV